MQIRSLLKDEPLQKITHILEIGAELDIHYLCRQPHNFIDLQLLCVESVCNSSLVSVFLRGIALGSA